METWGWVVVEYYTIYGGKVILLIPAQVHDLGSWSKEHN